MQIIYKLYVKLCKIMQKPICKTYAKKCAKHMQKYDNYMPKNEKNMQFTSL